MKVDFDRPKKVEYTEELKQDMRERVLEYIKKNC